MPHSVAPSDASPPLDAPQTWELRLYVAGATPRCLAALARLRTICDAHLPGQHRIEVVDLLREPTRAEEDEILAIPTLVRTVPGPIRKIIGDLSNTERTLIDLQLLPRPDANEGA